MQNKFMREAIRLAAEKMRQGHGGPFGAVIVLDGLIIASGYNQVTSTNDPTAHAEITAIRQACKTINDFRLTGCEMFINCEPCPMCLAAIYWAGIEKIYFAADRHDAAAIGFADEFIYQEISREPTKRKIKMTQLMRQEALAAFKEWQDMPNKIVY